jgi:5-methylcytosine-specific restriction endonuclease McrA
MDIKDEKIFKSIPHSLYIAMWAKNFGMKSGKEKCVECKKNYIYQLDFECKYKQDNNIHIDNLIPVCKDCSNKKKKKEKELESPLIYTKSPQLDKNRKDIISRQLRIEVWKKHIGMEKGEVKCLCCNIFKIQQLNFECGHIVAESLGGSTSIDNLMPICGSCNKSMGTKNPFEFQKILLTKKTKCCFFCFW